MGYPRLEGVDGISAIRRESIRFDPALRQLLPAAHYTPVTLLQPEPARMMIRVLHLRLSRTGGI